MKIKRLLFSVCLLLLTAIPRLSSLELHWSSDEFLWLRRSASFLSFVEQGDFSETRIAYHPGVTTMWIAGLRTLFMDPGIDVENLASARGFIGLVVWGCIGIACLLLYKLFGQWVALTSFACLAYSPLFLAQTRRVHTDALASVFILLTVMLFLLYCQKRQHLRYLILSGISFGLALLSKSYALILLPWLPVCLFLFQDKRIGGFWIPLAEILCFLNCALLTFLSLWPVFWTSLFGYMALCLFGLTCVLLRALKAERCPMWLVGVACGGLCLVGVRAIQTVWLVFEKVNWAVTTPHEVEHFFLGKVVNDPGVLFYPFVLMIKSTPLMLPLAIGGCLLLWKQRKRAEETARHFKIGLALVAGVLLFTLCLSATSKKFSRYLLPAFAMLEILAAIGFVEGLKGCYTRLVSRRRTEPRATYKTAFTFIACLSFFFIQTLPVLALHPYYGTYYNPCWKVADITKFITVGEASGLDIAANTLNEKQSARRMVVQVSPLAHEFFEYYFRGFAYSADNSTGIKHIADYEVVYIRDSQIGKVRQTGTLNGELEAVITLNGIEHVWIYRLRQEKKINENLSTHP